MIEVSHVGHNIISVKHGLLAELFGVVRVGEDRLDEVILSFVGILDLLVLRGFAGLDVLDNARDELGDGVDNGLPFLGLDGLGEVINGVSEILIRNEACLEVVLVWSVVGEHDIEETSLPVSGGSVRDGAVGKFFLLDEVDSLESSFKHDCEVVLIRV